MDTTENPGSNTTLVTSSLRPTKSATVIKLLSRNRGATLAEIMAATAWQQHSTRAFLTGLRKRGMELIRETRRNGETSWRIPA